MHIEEILGTESPLYALAGRMDKIFRLDSGADGDVVLLGALTGRSEFGISHHGPGRMSFGGRGWQVADALITCIGEAAEHLSFHERKADPLLLPSGPTSFDASQSAWATDAAGGPLNNRPRVAGMRSDGTMAYLPADLALRRPPAHRTSFRAAETTGLAAGPTLSTAYENALLEVVERDAVALWWWGGAPAWIYEAEFEATQNRRTWCLDITSDLDIPVIAALSASDSDDAVVVGFAAARTYESAAERAYLELRQMEMALSLSFAKLRSEGPDALSPQDRVILDRSIKLSIRDQPWLTGEPGEIKPTNFQDADCLSGALRRSGFEVFKVDLTRTDIAIPVLRVIVPGLQLIKPGLVSDRLSRMIEKYPAARQVDLPPPT